MPWSNHQFKISYLPNSCYVTVPKQGPVTACDNMNFWAPFSNNPRWIQVLHVNISCIYTIVQVTLLFLQEITFALQPKDVWKKTRCKSHPSPWTHSWRGVLSQVPPQLSLAAAESQKTWKPSHSPVFKGNSDIKMNPVKLHLTESCKILSLSNGKSSSSPATYMSR